METEVKTETAPFDGRNGTIILDAERIIVGKVSGRMYEYQRHLTVSVDIRVERLEREERYPDIHHEERIVPLNFSLLWSIWRPDGKDCVAAGPGARGVMEVVQQGKPAEGFTRANLRALAALAERWHRNDMRTACAHQKVVTRGGRTTADMCRESGYRYGERWLLEPLPAGFMATLSGLLAPANQERIYVLS